MVFSNLTILFKFLVGTLLLQGAAGILVYAALRSGQAQVWLLSGALALILGSLGALWFTSLAGHLRKDALSRERESLSRQREQIRVRAEREKTKVIQQSHQQIARERRRARNNAKLKIGASSMAVIGLGLLMLLTQFATLGLVLMSGAGGALGGYLFRARQGRLGGRKPEAIAAAARVIDAPRSTDQGD